VSSCSQKGEEEEEKELQSTALKKREEKAQLDELFLLGFAWLLTRQVKFYKPNVFALHVGKLGQGQRCDAVLFRV